ncbi:hypothetical protein CC86DRAFT_327596 [Ophiobolus disseminans]|uniref:Spindle pole body-associated protein cut12 domain-containing protein n=1 Tax=Ophiobolus disseminans TaxID=1469910 RepID=A0A6A6ZTF2_9PLEO|nr:hypothetical protein CC86DRAFT_327596 [Ophiobolus disseminans]
MFSWITGPRITDAIEDLQPENNYESTFLEPPETPAHHFAINAFKHAVFGTPAPEDDSKASKKQDKKAKVDAANAQIIELAPPNDSEPPLSPSKQPGGVLRTPGTASKGKKTVSFGSHVVDNEGKRGNIGKSGIPNDCPGKFPSPWTPGTELKLDHGSDKRPRTKLTEALLDARTTTQQKSGQKPKARDDSDITIDLGAPRSESGRYWKEQYESYAEKSEKEMKKVIAKQQLAKKFAMKKDGEVTELVTKLEQERKKFKQRERELEQQNNDSQERLRQAMSDNSLATIEIAALKARIAVLERSMTMTSSEVLQSKPSFQIYEDMSKDVVSRDLEHGKSTDVSFLPSVGMASFGKENSSPKSRRNRRQTLPESSAQASAPSRLGTGSGEASVILGRSSRAPAQSAETSFDPTPTPAPAPAPAKEVIRSPLKSRKAESRKENTQPEPQAVVPPSSPLPMPSPGLDPWMDLNEESSLRPVDKLAITHYAGSPYSRPEWNPPPKQHRAPKSSTTSANTKHTAPTKRDQKVKEPTTSDGKVQTSSRDRPTEPTTWAFKGPSKINTAEPHCQTSASSSLKVDAPKRTDTSSHHSPIDPKFDVSKLTAHHAEGSAQVTKDRAEVGPAERKADAKRRLEERKRLRKNPPT